jgi:hypothetical protein
VKRSFRVATAFAGAAALSAVLPVTEAHASAPPFLGNCTANMGTAVHLYYTKSENHPLAACAYGNPTQHTGWFSKRFQYYCGGDYSGNLIIGGVLRHYTDGTTLHDLYGQLVSAVSFSRYTNAGYTCPMSYHYP